jgi:asparagine synthase (glutamine-hydrolysing)
VSKAARELGLKSAISGLGGDELLGGYPSFRDIPRWVRIWAVPSRIPLLGDAFRHFAAASGLASVLHPKAVGLLKLGGSFASAYLLRRGLFMPWELNGLMDKDLITEGLRRLDPITHISATLGPMPRTNFAKIASLESSLYMRNQLLRDADWASMAYSLEVRVPLVDAHLLRTIAPALVSLPDGIRKRCLANSPQHALPPKIIARPKTGFGTPVNDWLQRDDRLQRWRQVPQLANPRCPWARRWAYQLAAA